MCEINFRVFRALRVSKIKKTLNSQLSTRMKFSKLLNILGMTVAFAALYIILVQVHYDLTYNRSIPDSERVYLMTVPKYNEDKLQSFLCRPHAELLLTENPYVEAYAVAKLDDINQNYVIVGEGNNAMNHAA